jgi:hypothetical protein
MSRSQHTGTVSCNEPECAESYAAHHWGAVKAADEGWFLQRDGTAWCPKHNPPWVADWRKRQAHYAGDDEQPYNAQAAQDT